MTSKEIPSAPKAKKALGQHFLRKRYVCAKIVRLLDCQNEDSILEIGPGPGALTTLLECEPHENLVLLEKDFFWARERQRLRTNGATRTILTDALLFDWTRLPASPTWKIVGNLPYNVASPLIWDIMEKANFSRAVFMVQKEVGQRLAALPGNRQYGALSVWVQNYATVSLDFCIGPEAFSPPPAVDSAVLTFQPLPCKPQNPQALTKLLHICFQQRRKQIGGILRRSNIVNAEEALELCGIVPTSRPEEIAPPTFTKLAEQLFGKD